MLLALAGLFLVRRLVPSRHLGSHTEATSTIHHAIAIVFGVTAAFAIFVAWEQLDMARATGACEAADVEALYRLARRHLPESDRTQLQEQARSYAELVAVEEWPLLAQDQASTQAQNTADTSR